MECVCYQSKLFVIYNRAKLLKEPFFIFSARTQLYFVSRSKRIAQMDFPDVLEKCGSFGRFQKVILLLYGYTNILGALHYFSQTLITFTPEHW